MKNVVVLMLKVLDYNIHLIFSLCAISIFLLAGCANSIKQHSYKSVGLPSELHLIEISRTSETKLLAQLGLSSITMLNELSAMGVDDAEIKAIQKDPFFIFPFTRISFEFLCNPQIISSYFLQKTERSDWKYERGILFIEHTNSGGDWVNVFKKNNSLVRIHITGYDEKLVAMSFQNKSPNSRAIRTVYVDFINCDPSFFFGKDFCIIR